MSLKNISGSDITGVKLARSVDADILTPPTSSISDDYAITTRRSATAFDNAGGGNLSLTATSRGRAVVSSVGNWLSSPWTSCAPFTETSVYGPNDTSMRVTYNLGTVNAGATRVEIDVNDNGVFDTGDLEVNGIQAIAGGDVLFV